ncbi:MAG: hypothetical protein JJU09_14560 [Rhodobacteraceae bacterium]|nr:hypothetical protein [Paracoccaceae bacterium]
MPDVGDAGVHGMDAETPRELRADDPDNLPDTDSNMPPPEKPGSPDTPQFGD